MPHITYKFFKHLQLPKLALYIAVSLLVGCSHSYQPAGFSGGYRDFPQDNGQHYISYYGNADLPLETTVDYALLRAAVIAQQRGFAYFSASLIDSGFNTTELNGGISIKKPFAKFVITFLTDNSPGAGATAQTINRLQLKHQLSEQQILR